MLLLLFLLYSICSCLASYYQSLSGLCQQPSDAEPHHSHINTSAQLLSVHYYQPLCKEAELLSGFNRRLIHLKSFTGQQVFFCSAQAHQMAGEMESSLPIIMITLKLKSLFNFVNKSIMIIFFPPELIHRIFEFLHSSMRKADLWVVKLCPRF